MTENWRQCHFNRFFIEIPTATIFNERSSATDVCSTDPALAPTVISNPNGKRVSLLPKRSEKTAFDRKIIICCMQLESRCDMKTLNGSHFFLSILVYWIVYDIVDFSSLFKRLTRRATPHEQRNSVHDNFWTRTCAELFCHQSDSCERNESFFLSNGFS